MALKENEIKWFRPLWVRVGVVVFLALWFCFEAFVSQDMFWALMVGVVGAYFAYTYVYAFPKEEKLNDQVPPPGASDGDDRHDP